MKRLLVLLALVTGCGSLHADYVRQDRANYETLAPVVRRLIQESDVLDPDEEADVEDRLNGWDARTSAAVKSLED